MSNETFFRMLSIAFLGAVALAFIPESQAESQTESLMQAVSDADALEIEIQSVQEVQDINTGRFNPAVAGVDLADFTNPRD